MGGGGRKELNPKEGEGDCVKERAERRKSERADREKKREERGR